MADDETSEFIQESCLLYRTTLLERVVPFWMRHGWDRRCGGISNVLDETGKALNHDKYLWSQGRALWTFSALYNRVEPRQEWLDFAHHIYRYLETNGRDERGYWMYRLDQSGRVVEKDTSIYVDGFVMGGLGEYYAAAGRPEVLHLALQTYHAVLDRLQRPGSYGVAPYEVPAGLKTLGIAMIYSFFCHQLGQIAGRSDLCQVGLKFAREILDEFYVPEKDAVLEFVTMGGEFENSLPGRTCVPGHVIEAMWFLITIFEQTGDNRSIATCCGLIRRHLELGWDAEFGGLKLAVDIDGREPTYRQNSEDKPWWVQVEALVATALAYRHTREAWCLDWHRRIQEWAFARYPVPNGEWRQWLSRTGQPTKNGPLPVKDPFHLPRALIYLLTILESLHPVRHAPALS